MKIIAFTQDIGVSRIIIDGLFKEHGWVIDWSLADNTEIKNSKKIEAICTANIALTAEELKKYSNLKVVSISFTGHDHVDKKYCLNNGIAVYNVPEYSTDSVAELAVGLSISLLRQIPKGGIEIKNGNWNENITGFELAGKKCGIIGTGAIGCRLSEMLKVFKCELLGWSRSEKNEFKKMGGKYVELEKLLADCDLIFITISLNKETKNLISDKEFSLMKTNSYLINVARGPIVNQESLINAANHNLIAGFGLDVYDYEPLLKEDEMRTLQSAILTPHVAYSTKEALKRKAGITVENILRFENEDKLNRII